MAIETFNVSFTLSRDNSNDDDDTWVDEEQIANEIRSWLEDIDYGVTDIKINNTQFFKLRDILIAEEKRGD